MRSFNTQLALGPMKDLEEEEDGRERIHLLTFSRHPREFFQALAQAEELQDCRSALQQAGFDWQLSCGTKIFVHPLQYAETVALMNKQEARLRKRHVIAAESLVSDVILSVFNLRSRLQVRVKNAKSWAQSLALRRPPRPRLPATCHQGWRWPARRNRGCAAR